ncbi:MAG: serralysin [Acidobacteriota bacterium]|jgi:hypothetical protein|nr:serralysin [Acidobacteriota bacterium]
MKRTRFALLLLLSSAWLGGAGPRGLAAQPVPLGPEIELPTNDFPSRPLLAVQPGGAYMVAWDDFSASHDEIFYRYIAPGREPADIWASSIESPIESPQTDAVTATPKGFDVIWHVSDDYNYKPVAFYRRHLNLKGVPDGQPVRLGGVGTDWVWQVRGNGFMAGWVLPNMHGIAARHLSSAGRRTGPELRLNSRPVDRPKPVVLAVPDGGFLAVWLGTIPGATANRVLRARRFSPAGKPLGSDFDVNTTPLGVGDEEQPFLDTDFQVAASPGGGFAVSWLLDTTIYLRFFDAAGQGLGPEVPAVKAENTWSTESIAFDKAGNLMLLWPTDSDLKLQLFDPHGAPLGPPTGVRSAASRVFEEPWGGSVAWAGDSWLVTWAAAQVPAGDFSTLFVRWFAGQR